MVGFNSARAVGKRRQFMVCVLLALAIVFGVCGLTVGSHGAEAEETTQAYYLGMDTNTHGNWYDSSKASGSNYTYADCPRLYGNDGFMINYAKITGDGQPETNLSRLSDYTEDSPVHYAKWPSYVANMSGSIESVNDVPH